MEIERTAPIILTIKVATGLVMIEITATIVLFLIAGSG